MAKLLFLPFSLGSGLLAGVVSKKLFGAVWGLIDKRQPPQVEQRQVGIGKLALALTLQGAVFRLVKGLVDHGARRSFLYLTGSWPGDDDDAGAREQPTR